MRRSRSKPFLGAAVVAACAAIASTASAQLNVAPAVSYAVGLRPSGVAVGDFNGDGRPDLATATDNPDKVEIHLADGAGSFTPGPVIFMPASSSPEDLLAGDLDGDGDIDIAVILRDLNQVRAIINNGGSFVLGASAPVGANARGMDMADIDGDGDLDIGVANRDSNTATVLRNNGNATFTAITVPQPVGAEPRAVAFGNFAGSGPLGLAVANHDIRMVNVFAANGTGFTPVAALSVGGNDRPDGIVAGDFNNDGREDIATASGDDTPSQNRVVLFLANSGSSFTGPFYFPTGNVLDSSDLVAADLDCDGALDLAVVNQTSNNISLLRNTGSGSFAAPIVLAAGTRPGRINAGDFDGDGDADLAVANRDSNNLSIYINHSCVPPAPVCGNGICEAGEDSSNCPGDCPPTGPVCGNGICEAGENSANCPGDCGGGGPPGSFAFASSTHFAGDQPSAVAAADLNNDGLIDLAVVADLNPSSENVAILLGTKSGFAAPFYVNLPNSSSPEDIVAGDLDGDGDADLAVGLKDNNAVIVLLNGGSANFTLGASAATGAEPRGMTLGDADGDGDLDIAVANRAGNSVTVLLNNGDATFASTTMPAGLEPRDAVWGRFDGDADLDLAVSNHGDRTISLYQYVGGGLFASSGTLSVGPQDRPDGLIAGDFDGDGLDDLAAASGDSTPAFNRAVVFRSLGAVNAFSGPAYFPTGPGALNTSELVAADLDCDGDLDLALTNKDSNNLSVLANNGTGVFGAAVMFDTGVAPERIIAADLKNKGYADLVIANRNSDDVTVLRNQQCGLGVVGDVNGDGVVNFDDLLEVISAWGPCGACHADVNSDGLVNFDDVLMVIAHWSGA